MLLAMALAFAFGALHALGPGHGKTLMAAYLVGSGGRARHAVAVGGAVAVMHTASVLALGFVVLARDEVFAERVYPWLGIGPAWSRSRSAWMLVARRCGLERGGRTRTTPARPPASRAPDRTRRFSRGRAWALAAAGGILPSPSALVVLLASVAAHRVGYGLP